MEKDHTNILFHNKEHTFLLTAQFALSLSSDPWQEKTSISVAAQNVGLQATQQGALCVHPCHLSVSRERCMPVNRLSVLFHLLKYCFNSFYQDLPTDNTECCSQAMVTDTLKILCIKKYLFNPTSRPSKDKTLLVQPHMVISQGFKLYPFSRSHKEVLSVPK